MTWLLKLYPAQWRRRYGAEIEELVASQPRSLQLVIDLLGGAIDARLRPQAFAQRLEQAPADSKPGGTDMVFRLKGCCAEPNLTPRQGLLSAGFSLLVGLALAAFLMTDPSQVTETVALTMFPAFLVAPMNWMLLRGHSKPARLVLFCGPFLLCFMIGLVAGLAVSG